MSQLIFHGIHIFVGKKKLSLENMSSKKIWPTIILYSISDITDITEKKNPCKNLPQSAAKQEKVTTTSFAMLLLVNMYLQDVRYIKKKYNKEEVNLQRKKVLADFQNLSKEKKDSIGSRTSIPMAKTLISVENSGHISIRTKQN